MWGPTTIWTICWSLTRYLIARVNIIWVPVLSSRRKYLYFWKWWLLRMFYFSLMSARNFILGCISIEIFLNYHLCLGIKISILSSNLERSVKRINQRNCNSQSCYKNLGGQNSIGFWLKHLSSQILSNGLMFTMQQWRNIKNSKKTLSKFKDARYWETVKYLILRGIKSGRLNSMRNCI